MTYQWNIFWADLNPVKSSEQAGKRPVLVVSEEAVNQALPIVAVLSLTGFKPGRKVYPVEVLIEPPDSQLPQTSLVMAHQIRSVSKERLGEKCGSIGSEECREKIRGAVKVYLDLF